MNKLLQGSVDTVLYRMNPDTEVLEVDTAANLKIDGITAKFPKNEPRFVIHNFAHEHEGKKAKAFVFFYFCPDVSKPRLKMMYSSCKGIVIKLALQSGIDLKKNLEASEPNELTPTVVVTELYPKKDEKVAFKKPTAGGKGKGRFRGAKFNAAGGAAGGDADGGGGEYLLKNELFATGFGIKWVDTKGDSLSFFPAVSSLVNQKFFGSLSCTIVIDPTTRKNLGQKFDEFLYDVNWGTVGINIWAAMMAMNPYGTWGAPTNRHNDTNIQSGVGKMGNCLLLQNVNKSVIDAKFCDPMMASLLGPPTASYTTKSLAYASLALNQTVGALVKMLLAFNK